MHKINRRINLVNQEIYSHTFYPYEVKEYFTIYRIGYIGEVLQYKKLKSSMNFMFLFSNIYKERKKA